MGYGHWSDADYKKTPKGKAAFGYSHDILRKSREEQRVHQLLDPFGLKTRESRDSAEHPESSAIGVGLDVTGSMAAVVVATRDSLGKLMEMLLNGKYISDPQLLFYAVGDATCDVIPFQVSQFESDIKINDQLTLVVLEGGGGGQLTESYELGFYCMARHTSIDCWEKRHKKGYLISIGDEMPYPQVGAEEVKRIFDASLAENVPLENAVREAQEKYNTFHIIPKGSHHYNDPAIREAWSSVLGGSQYVFMLEDPAATAETIALAIGLNEGRITLEEGLSIVAKNSGQTQAVAVQKALEEFARHAATKPKAKHVSPTKGKPKPKKDIGPKDWKL